MKFTLIKTISKSLGTRYVKYGGFAVIITAAVVAGLVFLNLIFQQFSPQFDMTTNKLFSLSEQTLQVLEEVKSPVIIYGIWEPGGENMQVREVAELYASKNRLVSFREIDPDLNPILMRRLDPDNKGVAKGSLIVEGEKGFKVLSLTDMYDVYYDPQLGPQISGISIEKRLTGALLYTSTGETPVVYEVSGHGEAPLAQLMLAEAVELENFALRELNLLQAAVPANASALILNNPLEPLEPVEAEKILAYLEGGGRLLVMLDFRSKASDSINGVLTSYGIRFDPGIVMEYDANYSVKYVMGPPLEFIPSVLSHDIVKPLVENKTPPVLPGAMGVSILDTRRRTIGAVPLLRSSGSSFMRTDMDNSSFEQSPGDLSGPITLGAAVMDPEYNQGGPQARIVAIGCSAFMWPDERYTHLPGNLDLFMNSLNWLEERPENLSVRSRSTFVMPMRITVFQLLGVGVAFVVVIPLVFFMLALVTWLRRRHL